MNSEATIERLHDLRLGVMAEAFAAELARDGDHGLSFAERFGIIVEQQWLAREASRLARRIRNAGLKLRATMAEVDFSTPRGLDRDAVLELAELEFVRSARNLIITGPTGIGKTYLACAFAHRACERGFTALYKRTPLLVSELALARAEDRYLDLIKRISGVEVLVLDDWALAPLDHQGASDVMDVIDDRAGVRTTIVSSQLPVREWHSEVADPTIADALLDRLVHNADRIEMTGGSMRKEA